MKDLKTLEQKYLELGKEIEALKTRYYLGKKSNQVVKFTDLTTGEIVKQSNIKYPDGVGKISQDYIPYTDTEVWQQLEVCTITGFFDGQLVWCWNESDTHSRVLRFYQVRGTKTFSYNGKIHGAKYKNYEAYEGNYPQWALDAFDTLER